MNQTTAAQSYGQALLEYVPVCYGVAFALTQDAGKALELTLKTIVWAWHEHGDDGEAEAIKGILLTALRNGYLREYAAPSAQPAAIPLHLQSGNPFPVPSE